MMWLERALTKAANVVRGKSYYWKYKRMFEKDLTNVPSFKLISGRVSGRIVDLGCGIGYLSGLFSQYVGCDASLRGLKIAQSYSVRQLVRGDILKLPFKSCSFDWAMLYDVIEHIPEIENAISEVRRVARNAAFAVVDFSSYYRWFTHDETHIGHLLPEEIHTTLRAHYNNLEVIRTSGLFSVPGFINRILEMYLPNEVVFFCYGGG